MKLILIEWDLDNTHLAVQALFFPWVGTVCDSVLSEMREPWKEAFVPLIGDRKQEGTAGQNMTHTPQKPSCKASRQGSFLFILFPEWLGKRSHPA